SDLVSFVGPRKAASASSVIASASAAALQARPSHQKAQTLPELVAFVRYAYLSVQPKLSRAVSNYAPEWQKRYFDAG
ncbi:hypothetical protein, partial [Streptococcus pneumoniae]|uniref:hypothetical protein n=1 Tax=Streptococcus pneumoniae TaxID=1313 RepID=UPI001954483C